MNFLFADSNSDSDFDFITWLERDVDYCIRSKCGSF